MRSARSLTRISPDDKLDIQWQRALNHNLPRDISVIDVVRVPETFHARYDAHSKIYTYSLWLTRQYVLPQRRVFVWANRSAGP